MLYLQDLFSIGDEEEEKDFEEGLKKAISQSKREFRNPSPPEGLSPTLWKSFLQGPSTRLTSQEIIGYMNSENSKYLSSLNERQKDIAKKVLCYFREKEMQKTEGETEGAFQDRMLQNEIDFISLSQQIRSLVHRKPHLENITVLDLMQYIHEERTIALQMKEKSINERAELRAEERRKRLTEKK